MGQILMPSVGGGADTSIVTAAANDVVKGKVIVDKDGNPLTGTLTLSGNAADNHVLAGQTYYNTDLKTKRIGTMPNHAGRPQHIDAVRIQNNRFEVAVAAGYHGYSWAGNSYEYMEYSQVASAIGLTAAKLAKGQTVCGIAGTYTSDATAAASNVEKNKTVYVNGSKVTGTMETMAGSTITPSTSSRTISCSGKKMTSNIVINPIPSTYKNITDSIYFFRNGVWFENMEGLCPAYNPNGNSSIGYNIAKIPTTFSQSLNANKYWQLDIPELTVSNSLIIVTKCSMRLYPYAKVLMEFDLNNSYATPEIMVDDTGEGGHRHYTYYATANSSKISTSQYFSYFVQGNTKKIATNLTESGAGQTMPATGIVELPVPSTMPSLSMYPAFIILFHYTGTLSRGEYLTHNYKNVRIIVKSITIVAK